MDGKRGTSTRRSPPILRSDHEDAFDPHCGREDFRLMMMDLAFLAEPFSKDTDADR